MSIEHPFFNSYKKNTNNISKNDDKLDFVALYENLNFISKEKIARGESVDIVAELNSYAGNISTKQLKNIDYSKFSNHTFFDSAVHKVSYAYNEIINYPYDKPEQEVKKYLSELDGYTEYVLENIYPKYTGHINFDGQTKIAISDRKGILLNDYKGDLTRRDGYLSPNSNFSFSFHIKTNEYNINLKDLNQTIFKKTRVDENNIVIEGYFCYLTFVNEDTCLLKFGIKTSNVDTHFECSIKVDYDKVSLVNINVNSIDDMFNADFFINGNLQEKTSNSVSYASFSDEFKNKDVQFILGHGEKNSINDKTLKGGVFELDEFIFYDKNRDSKTQKLFSKENIYTDKNVLLYLKFNEPGGSHINSSLILDSSGNKLHGILLDTDGLIIDDTSDIKSEVSFLDQEDVNKSPVILGTFPDIVSTRNTLVETAKLYDSENSNIIFNLLPIHYFTNSSNFENKEDFMSSEVVIENSIGFADNTTQKNTHLTNICLIWARFFDQLKLYVDALSGLYDLDYDSINRSDFVNSQMHLLCKLHGFEFKEIDYNKSKRKNENKNLTYEDVITEVSLVKLQNLIWKKILMNSQGIIRSKGTFKSLNMLFNSIGFDSKKYVNIEEKSYENFVNVEDKFINESIKFKALDFGKSIDINSEFINNDIDVSNKPILKIKDIRSRKDANIVDGVYEELSVEMFFDLNKLLYSQSIYENSTKYNTTQSIMRFNASDVCFINLTANFKKPTDEFFDLVLEYIPYDAGGTENKQIVKISNINAYDMEHYVNVSFKYNDSLNKIDVKLHHGFTGDVLDKNRLSTSIKAVSVRGIQKTSLFLFEKNFDIVVGEQNYTETVLLEQANNRTKFEGRMLCVRLWKKYLSESECLFHAKDILNISESNMSMLSNSNLLSNFTFNNCTYSDTGTININNENYSKPYVDLDDNGDELNTILLKFSNVNIDSDIKLFSYIDLIRKKSNSKLDLNDSNHMKSVKILSYNDEENKKSFDNFESYPTHDIPVDYENHMTDFVSIDMSVVKPIDEAISRLISNIEDFSKILTDNLSMYQYDYHLLDRHRREYFDKYSDLESSVNFEEINNLYKYFDIILNNILFSMMPQNINFKGFNLVYESHVLERAKYQNKNKDSNVPIQDIYNYNFTRLSKDEIISKRDMNYNRVRQIQQSSSAGQ